MPAGYGCLAYLSRHRKLPEVGWKRWRSITRRSSDGGSESTFLKFSILKKTTCGRSAKLPFGTRTGSPLQYGYFIKCTDVIKDEAGKIIELRCTYDPDERGSAPDGRKVKHCTGFLPTRPAEVRLYEHLFTVEDPGAAEDFTECLNPRSLEVLSSAMVEPILREATPGSSYQFERLGYFCVDPDSTAEKLVFNRTVSLRDTWAKIRETKQVVQVVTRTREAKKVIRYTLPGLNCISFFRRIFGVF